MENKCPSMSDDELRRLLKLKFEGHRAEQRADEALWEFQKKLSGEEEEAFCARCDNISEGVRRNVVAENGEELMPKPLNPMFDDDQERMTADEFGEIISDALGRDPRMEEAVFSLDGDEIDVLIKGKGDFAIRVFSFSDYMNQCENLDSLWRELKELRAKAQPSN